MIRRNFLRSAALAVPAITIAGLPGPWPKESARYPAGDKYPLGYVPATEGDAEIFLYRKCVQYGVDSAKISAYTDYACRPLPKFWYRVSATIGDQEFVSIRRESAFGQLAYKLAIMDLVSQIESCHRT